MDSLANAPIPLKFLRSANVAHASQRYQESRFSPNYSILNSRPSIYVSNEIHSKGATPGKRTVAQLPPKTAASTSQRELLLEGNDLSSQSPPARLSPNRRRAWRQQHLSGWSVGVAGCALLVTLSLLLNIVFLMFTLAQGGISSGFALLYHGSCSKSTSLMFWFHVTINLLSSALLSASNYCMQVLSSPTRAEIDQAHSKRQWLDIGLQSFRNVTSASTRRQRMWWVLVLSSMPLHLMYNSATFSMFTAYEYHVVVATQNFLLPQLPPNLTAHLDPAILTIYNRSQSAGGAFEKLDAQDCITIYSQQFVTDRSHLIVVLQNNWTSIDTWMNNGGWVNGSYLASHNSSLAPYFGTSRPLSPLYLSELVNTTAIDHCLSEIATGGCRVLVAFPILAIIIFCNILKAVTMLRMLRSRKSKIVPLVTIGDAIQSFIENPDPTTKDVCLYDRKMVETGDWAKAKSARQYVSRGRLWFGACSTRRWVITNLLATLTLSVFAYIVLSQPISGTASWTLGFSTVSEDSIIHAGTTGKGLSSIASSILLANLPQALFALLFLSYNNLYTFMCAADEWSRFAYERKTLRVTSPTGDQRSTYYLQMPYKAALPLVATAFLFHWLVSETVYFARVAVYDLDGHYAPENDISTIGYSLLPAVLLLCLGIPVLPLFGIGIGFRTFKPGLPLAGGCSAVISAACHGFGEEEGEDEVLRPLMWGVVREPEQVEERYEGRNDWMQGRDGLWNPYDRPGHCAFSSQEVALPTQGNLYK